MGVWILGHPQLFRVALAHQGTLASSFQPKAPSGYSGPAQGISFFCHEAWSAVCLGLGYCSPAQVYAQGGGSAGVEAVGRGAQCPGLGSAWFLSPALSLNPLLWPVCHLTLHPKRTAKCSQGGAVGSPIMTPRCVRKVKFKGVLKPEEEKGKEKKPQDGGFLSWPQGAYTGQGKDSDSSGHRALGQWTFLSHGGVAFISVHLTWI